jgi:lipopolysaccharide transport system permease protein
MKNMTNCTKDTPHIQIKPAKGWQLVDFKEISKYRDLFYFLVIRDIKVKYKQTVLGGLWAIIRPFFMMVVFTLFFGKLAKIPSDGIPYPIFSYTAMVAWMYFSTSIADSANSLIGEANLISKVYFPRVIVPLSPVLAGLLDFCIAFIVLIGMMVYYNIYPNRMIVFLPVLILLMILTASGVGMFLAALNAKYRDIRYTIPFIIQLWMFASPVVYPASLVPGKYQFLYALNPMVGVIEGFRAVLLGTVAFPTQIIAISALVSVILFVFGLFYFKQMERYFADVV